MLSDEEPLLEEDLPDLLLPVVLLLPEDLAELEPLVLAFGVEEEDLVLPFFIEDPSEPVAPVEPDELFLEPEVEPPVKPVEEDIGVPELPRPLPPVSPELEVDAPEMPVDCNEPNDASELELLPMLPDDEDDEPEVDPMLPLC